MEAFARLRAILAEVDDLQRAAAVLSWDRECTMPPGGARARTEQLATLQRLAHERFASDEVGELLERLEPWARTLDPEGFEARLLRVTRRRYARARRTPAELVSALAHARGEAQLAWRAAREQRDARPFLPALRRLVELQRQLCDALGYEGHPYDALLDAREPGLTSAFLDALFARLKEVQVPLIAALAGASAPDPGAQPLDAEVDPRRVFDFTVELLAAVGFDFRRGRQDYSVHPFTTMFSPDDVRLTLRVGTRTLRALFTALHEGGHALYDQGIPAEYARTPLCGGASGGVHESQSRLWENLVGRSLPFWQWLAPRLRQAFPELPWPGAEGLYRQVNRVAPGPIRTGADEVTYNLHVILRYELEKAMLTGDLPVDEAPAAWRERLRAYLGVEPRDDLEGMLQDIHWTRGFGGFPSYTLGNVISVQLWEAARRDLPDLPEQLAAGRFADLLGWLREAVHRHGAALEPQELVQRATGSPIDPEPYLRYLREKYGALYGVAA